ncbi:MAG: FAD-dependent oxidoreductase [Alphaproteobacteria bacterium]|jgi:fumarate reductase flavoprotein subunit|nr:FAD-dependent oxidoreductase [Alphaproteobacteria bacterium]MBT4084694.1 FAD-dependent oxidoreductase [Alphaproteobacteria bacterium]MBT4544650.1 FAD-dependent oxidoreductase [Alphaproteobacteria bacterium]MBT7744936.1 FAD-dependent oxidoreductase [Alphaproteobacteria bacterium]
MSVIDDPGSAFDLTVPVVVIGGGACGLVAALSAHDNGAEVIVLERDPVPKGSTALSSGMITACGTALQKAADIDDDTAELFARDIQSKAGGKADPHLLAAICAGSGPAIDWLIECHNMDLVLVDGPPYPGHSRQRTHAPPTNSGADLMADLLRAVDAAHIDVICNATVKELIVDGDKVSGVVITRPDGSSERLGCQTLVLASSGFGGNADMVKSWLPDMAGSIYFGHEGNQGEAVLWGQALGAACEDMGAFQGHGSVATPHAITVSWALLNNGGILVNQNGIRFCDESLGASELAATVCQQDGNVWSVIDQSLYDGALRFADFKNLQNLGAIKSGMTAAELAQACRLPAPALEQTLATLKKSPALTAPYHAIKVTGALLQTQGGLAIDSDARVKRPDGSTLPNLFAGGGAARGISGTDGSGYLSCNGLLSAVTLGRIAGREAAIQATALP